MKKKTAQAVRVKDSLSENINECASLDLSKDTLQDIAINTITAINNSGNLGWEEWPAGHLKKLFAEGADVPHTKPLNDNERAKVQDMENLMESVKNAADGDLVQFPNALAAEFAFEILKKEGCCALERAELRLFTYDLKP